MRTSFRKPSPGTDNYYEFQTGHSGIDIQDQETRPGFPNTPECIANPGNCPWPGCLAEVGSVDIDGNPISVGNYNKDDRDYLCDDWRGAAVFAAANGYVRVAELRSDQANAHAVYIDHGTLADGRAVQTRYLHLGTKVRDGRNWEIGEARQSFIQVEEGECVQAGDLIGYQGYSGRTEATHLHYEVHVDGVAMDPANWPSSHGGRSTGRLQGTIDLIPPSACACPSGQTLCQNRCVSECAAGQILDETRCICSCPAGQSLCNGRCVGNCPAGQTRDRRSCECTCPRGKTKCGADCIDLNTDPNHCGACDNPCRGGTCSRGRCQCSAGFKRCGNTCRDTRNDPDNCSNCGVVCPGVPHATRACVRSACAYTCETGWGDCDGDILRNGCERDLRDDHDNCGFCGFSCDNVSEHMICIEATCACRDGFGFCGGACAPLGTVEHCRTCGEACVANDACQIPVCDPDEGCRFDHVADGAPCGDGGICQGGTCQSSSLDLEVIAIEPLSSPVCANSVPTFRASIRNNGSAASGGFNIRWIADGSLIFDGGHFSIPPGAVDTHDHIWKNADGQSEPIGAGSHSLTFIADLGDALAETNEGNNELTIFIEPVACASESIDEPQIEPTPSPEPVAF